MVKITVGGKTLEQPTKLFINNEWVSATSGKTIDALNPATEELLATVEAASAEDVDRAVKAARKAYNEVWRNVTGTERGELLRKLAAEIEADHENLTALETADSGKPRDTNAAGDVTDCVGIYNYYAGWADKIEGKVSMDDPKRHAYVRHQPYGVVGQIIPWNYPLLMAAWKIGPAIAAGNVVILKTAEATPLSMLYFCELVKRAGFPPGVINVISGYGPEAGDALSRHMDVDKVAFTGSTATGKFIMKAAAESNIKNVTLELGGKSPMVVFDDCDVEQAAKWAYFGIMFNMGQVCSATSRLIVQEGIHDEFVKALTREIESETIIGDTFAEKVNHGPQVNKVQFEKILNYIDVGRKEGAKVVTGGKRWGTKGYYVEPTVFSNVTNDMRIAQEEIFGPVVVCVKFKDYDEAIKIANDTSYGLGGAVFTKDITKAHRAAAEIDTGTVWINSTNDQDFHVPFGGHKMSGIGSELGGYGLSAYLVPKTVQVNLGYRL